MKPEDIFIILMMALLFAASVYFNFIFPKKLAREKLEKEKETKRGAR